MALSNTSPTLGANFALTYTVSTTDPSVPAAPFRVGQVLKGQDGSEWVFVLAGSAITSGYACVIGTTFTADMITTTNGLRGLLVGVPQVAIASAEYGWLQRAGTASVGVRVLASAAANARLNTTATAGALDDDATTGAKEILGIALTTANGGSAALAPAVLNFPAVGVTL